MSRSTRKRDASSRPSRQMLTRREAPTWPLSFPSKRAGCRPRPRPFLILLTDLTGGPDECVAIHHPLTRSTFVTCSLSPTAACRCSYRPSPSPPPTSKRSAPFRCGFLSFCFVCRVRNVYRRPACSLQGSRPRLQRVTRLAVRERTAVLTPAVALFPRRKARCSRHLCE